MEDRTMQIKTMTIGIWIATLMWGMLLIGMPMVVTAAEHEGWEQLHGTAFDSAFIKTGAALDGYDKVVIDPLSVWYVKEPSDDPAQVQANLDQLRSGFRSAFEERLARDGLEIVDEQGADVLRLHVEIIDLKINAPSRGQNPWANRYQFDVSPKRLTLVAELCDSVTDEVLIRLADQEKALDDEPAVMISIWDEVELAFMSWSNGLSQTIGGAVSPDTLLVHAED